MAGSKAKDKKPSRISPEARERLSRLAKERHARGELGGPENGRKGGLAKAERQRRASTAVAEAARRPETSRKIIKVFEDAVADTQPIAIRMKAASEWVKIDQSEGKLEIAEQEADSRERSREELLEVLSEKLTSGAASALLRQALGAGDDDEDVVDAEVVDDGP